MSAKITILTNAKSVTRDGKTGPYTKVTQLATFENASMKMPIDLEVEGEASGYAIGSYTVDLDSQLKVGKYGLELPRYWKLVSATKA